jgi:hypothetical protein
MVKFDIPINFTVLAESEQNAVLFVHKLLKSAIHRRGLGDIIEFEDFIFIANESSCIGCGNHDQE